MVDFPDVKPDKDSVKMGKPRVLEAGFGDGYSQNALDGINTLNEEWDLRFSSRNKSVIDTIESFLKSVTRVTPFNWSAPDDVGTKQWRLASDWDITDAEWQTRTIRFTIRRYYG